MSAVHFSTAKAPEDMNPSRDFNRQSSPQVHMPALDPSSRLFIPCEIWTESCGLADIECHVSGQRLVLGRCSACEFCHCSGEYDKIELKTCSQCELCDRCGERTAHGDTIIIAIEGDLPPQTNGRAGSIAGCGIFDGIDSPYNKSFTHKFGRQNTTPLVQFQRAKLYAIICALQKARNVFRLGGPKGRGPNKHLEHINETVIKTDSKYIADSLSIHIVKWRSNGYTNMHGLPMVSQNFIKQIDSLCGDLADLGVQVCFWRVPDWFNDRANKLALAALDDSKSGRPSLKTIVSREVTRLASTNNSNPAAVMIVLSLSLSAWACRGPILRKGGHGSGAGGDSRVETEAEGYGLQWSRWRLDVLVAQQQ